MLLQRSDCEHNPPPCEQLGETVGKAPAPTASPDPHRVVCMGREGIETVMPFPGWDCVFALIIRDGAVAMRDGSLVVVTRLHWAAQQWGHA